MTDNIDNIDNSNNSVCSWCERYNSKDLVFVDDIPELKDTQIGNKYNQVQYLCRTCIPDAIEHFDIVIHLPVIRYDSDLISESNGSQLELDYDSDRSDSHTVSKSIKGTEIDCPHPNVLEKILTILSQEGYKYGQANEILNDYRNMYKYRND